MNKKVIWSFLISVLLGQCNLLYAQNIVAKTNILYDMTSTINLGMEFGLGPKWTLDLSGNYNPWTFSDNHKIKHWMVQPEVRYWTCQRYRGHFIGLHTHYAFYNLSGTLPWGIKTNFIKNNRYQGWLAGTGVSYGYQWILSNRWNLEVTVGLGYAYAKYDKYPCYRCSEKKNSGNKHFVGPTKVGLSLIYVIK